MDPLHATIEEFSAEGFTHIECHCPRCRMMRLRPMSWLPRITMGLTIAQLSARLRCAACGGPLHSVKPWRLDDVPGGFKVSDANGQSLAYVYSRENENDAHLAKVLTEDEARRIASNIAKLPELLG